VARRASFTSVVAHSAATVADAAGLGSDWVTGVGIGAALIGSYYYDNAIMKGSGSGSSSSQREQAKAAVREVNSSAGHSNVTASAAQTSGWENFSDQLIHGNLAQDGPASGMTEKLLALANNQDHFGRLPASVSSIHAQATAAFSALGPGGAGSYLSAIARATHFIQDHLTLGHMVPGTASFAGPIGAPLRLVIHQVFGGEIAFRQAQLRATQALLRRFPPPTMG
jgi:hypothetical protein